MDSLKDLERIMIDYKKFVEKQQVKREYYKEYNKKVRKTQDSTEEGRIQRLAKQREYNAKFAEKKKALSIPK